MGKLGGNVKWNASSVFSHAMPLYTYIVANLLKKKKQKALTIMKNSWFSNLEIEKIIRDLNQVEEDGERLNREEQKQTRVQVDDQESVRGEQVEKRDA